MRFAAPPNARACPTSASSAWPWKALSTERRGSGRRSSTINPFPRPRAFVRAGGDLFQSPPSSRGARERDAAIQEIEGRPAFPGLLRFTRNDGLSSQEPPMTYANILVETHGGVGLIRLNRPQALNALSA